MCECRDTHVEVRGQPHVQSSPNTMFEAGSLCCCLTVYTRTATQWASRGSPIPTFYPAIEVLGSQARPRPASWFWDSHSGLHALKGRTLLTEPSSQPIISRSLFLRQDFMASPGMSQTLYGADNDLEPLLSRNGIIGVHHYTQLKFLTFSSG